METLLSIALGLGLAAACGFRIFVPFLVVGGAARADHLDLASGFDWMASDAALITFAVATALEVGAYYIPWIDNLLDTLATPTAVVAGVVVSASAMGEMSPLLQWALAATAGGSMAAIFQSASVAARGLSSFGTLGLANPILATAELVGSFAVAALTVIAPLVGLALVLLATVWVVRRLMYRRARPIAS